MSTHGPIEEKFRALMNETARALDRLFNGEKKGADREVAFVLLTWNFGEGGRANYISNGERPEMITAMKELVARFEGRHIEETQTPLPTEKQ